MYYSNCSYNTKVGAESKGVKNGKLQIFGEKIIAVNINFTGYFVFSENKLQAIEHGLVTLRRVKSKLSRFIFFP